MATKGSTYAQELPAGVAAHRKMLRELQERRAAKAAKKKKDNARHKGRV